MLKIGPREFNIVIADIAIMKERLCITIQVERNQIDFPFIWSTFQFEKSFRLVEPGNHIFTILAVKRR